MALPFLLDDDEEQPQATMTPDESGSALGTIPTTGTSTPPRFEDDPNNAMGTINTYAPTTMKSEGAAPEPQPAMMGNGNASAPMGVTAAPNGKIQFHTAMHDFDTAASKVIADQMALDPTDPDYLKNLNSLMARSGQIKADRAAFEKLHPWGSPESAHPGNFGKVGHVLGEIGNIAGNFAAPGAMTLIPGTNLNLRSQGKEGENEVNQAEENVLKTSQAGELDRKLPTAAPKTPEEQFMNDALHGGPNGGPKADKAGVPYNYLSAHRDWEQTAQDVKPEKVATKDEKLQRYAELRNSQARTPDEDKEFQTLQTQYSVGKPEADKRNQQIQNELASNPKTAKQDIGPYTVLPTDTDVEAKDKLSAAKDLVNSGAAQQHITVSENHPAVAELASVERESRTNVRKADAAWRDVQEKTQTMDDFINSAKGGNKSAVKIVPLEGALEITTSQGVKRINRNEIEQISGAGSLYDKIVGLIGKGVSGKDISDSVLNDMQELGKVLRKNGYQKYNDTYEDEKGIYEGAGGKDFEKKLPKLAPPEGIGQGGKKPLPF